jgi:hypothetical protein
MVPMAVDVFMTIHKSTEKKTAVLQYNLGLVFYVSARQRSWHFENHVT